MSCFAELQWRPTIGDPTFVGWLTVVAYVTGSAIAVLTAMVHRDIYVDRAVHVQASKLWFTVALLMAGLATNKQLDLQSLFTDIGRTAARCQGWYEHRRVLQEFFVLSVIVGSAGLSCWLTWRYHTLWRQHKLLFVGLSLLLTFIVVRAVSFHHVDEMLDSHLLGFRMNWVLELSGIFLVCWAARRELVVRSTTLRNQRR